MRAHDIHSGSLGSCSSGLCHGPPIGSLRLRATAPTLLKHLVRVKRVCLRQIGQGFVDGQIGSNVISLGYLGESG